MMFVDNPTEQTTAATDAILALLAFGGLILLLRLKSSEPSKVRIWSVALGCLAVASAAGAVAHGVQVSQRVHDLLWLAIYLCLGLLVASFTIGTVYDLWGEGAARRIAPVMIVIAFLFFAGTQVSDGAFAVFVVYEAVAMSFALLGYLWLGLIGQLPGARLMTAGILVTLIAAVIQTTRAVPQISVVWTFNHNGLFHVVQMPGVVLIVSGLPRSSTRLQAVERPATGPGPHRTSARARGGGASGAACIRREVGHDRIVGIRMVPTGDERPAWPPVTAVPQPGGPAAPSSAPCRSCSWAGPPRSDSP